MEDWAKVKEHTESNITLLCDRHHREKTAGLLPLDVVRAADNDPHNRRVGQSSPIDLHYSGKVCNVGLGGVDCEFKISHVPATFVAVSIRRIPLISFSLEDEQLFLNMQVFDSAGNRVLWIDQNELRYGLSSWDIEWVGQVLTLRSQERELLFEVKFVPPDRVDVLRGYLMLNGYELLVHPKVLLDLNNVNAFEDVSLVSTHTALNIGAASSHPTALALKDDNPYFQRISREEVASDFQSMGIPVWLQNGRFVVRGYEGAVIRLDETAQDDT